MYVVCQGHVIVIIDFCDFHTSVASTECLARLGAVYGDKDKASVCQGSMTTLLRRMYVKSPSYSAYYLGMFYILRVWGL